MNVYDGEVIFVLPREYAFKRYLLHAEL